MMEGWKQVKLADYYKISSGLSKSADQFGSGYPFVSFKDVFWNYFLPEDLTELVNTTEKEQDKCSVKKGDIFLTRTSEKVEELGMSCVSLKNYPFATFNGFTKRLRPTSDNIDPKFIGFYLRSPQFRAEITAYSTLTTRASLNNDIIGRLRINLPPLPTQRKIASILSAHNDLIENNHKRIKLLEEKAQLIYEEWFVRMKFPGHETTPVNEETGLPEGWIQLKLTDLYSIKYGKNLSQTNILSSGEYPVYGASGVMGFYSDFNCDSKVVLVTSRGNGSGEVHRTYENKSFVTNNSFVFQPKKEFNQISLSFSFEFLRVLDLTRYCSGSAQPQLTNSAMLNVKIKLPSSELLSKYKGVSEELITVADNLKVQNQLLKEARDILLPRLMSGMIDLNQITIEKQVA